MAQRSPASTRQPLAQADKRPAPPEWLNDVRKAFKRHRMGRPGWFVGVHRDRLRLTSDELPPRPGEPVPADPAKKVTRALLLGTPPGPTTIGSAIAELCAVFDAVLAGTWRWPEDPLNTIQLDPRKPLDSVKIVALSDVLRLRMEGETLKKTTWERCWAPYLAKLKDVASSQSWASDADLLMAYLKLWKPNTRSRQMAHDRARRLWTEARRVWPDEILAIRGRGNAAAPPEGVLAFTDREIDELRSRILRSRNLGKIDLVIWDVLIVFGLRPAELQGLELRSDNGLLVAEVTYQKRNSKGKVGQRVVTAVPPAGWPPDCYGLFDRWKGCELPEWMLKISQPDGDYFSPGQKLTQQLRRLRAQSPVAIPLSPELTTYGLRHAFALRLGLELGLHVREAAELMGHSAAVHLNEYGKRLDEPKLLGKVEKLVRQRSSL